MSVRVGRGVRTTAVGSVAMSGPLSAGMTSGAGSGDATTGPARGGMSVSSRAARAGMTSVAVSGVVMTGIGGMSG